jgi:hypothetical protein
MTKKGGFRKNWLERWFVLSCDESALPRLIYFDNDTQTALKGYVAHALCVRAVAKRP